MSQKNSSPEEKFIKSVVTFFLFMMLLTFLFGLTACAKEEGIVCNEKIEASDGRPSILVIGDSISIAYMPYIQAALPAYQVVHNPCNAMNSRHTKANIDEWLRARPTWAAVTFNNALWDGADFARVYDTEYTHNITYIASAIKLKTSAPLFILGTYVPINAPYRTDARQVMYNGLASSVMTSLSIPTVDLYSISSSNLGWYVNPALQDDVHFEAVGSQALANEILNQLNTQYGIN